MTIPLSLRRPEANSPRTLVGVFGRSTLSRHITCVVASGAALRPRITFGDVACRGESHCRANATYLARIGKKSEPE